jgi:xanthine/uracil permease
LTKHDVIALLGALLFTGLMILLLYLVFNRWWTVLPTWVTLPLTVLISVAAIGSPIYTLKRVSDRILERQLERRGTSGSQR